MTKDQIIDNLERTIAGKEILLGRYEKARKLNISNDDLDGAADLAIHIAFLQINLEELNKILADVRQLKD
jgi:hypothetical protein